MNERIKELIKEAGISTTEYYRNLDDPKMFYSKSIVNEWSEDFKQQLNLEPYLRVKAMDGSTLEKFAELIVGECIGLVEKDIEPILDGSDYAEHWNMALRSASNEIKNHFGVE